MNTDRKIKALYNKDPILIIDDSEGERELIRIAFTELGVDNEIIFFSNGFTFLEYIRLETKGTFFILCDVNMPGLTGMDIKRIVQDDEQLRLKCIPFILFSTSSASISIKEAYSHGVQGYFVKPNEMEQLVEIFYAIVCYWNFSETP